MSAQPEVVLEWHGDRRLSKTLPVEWATERLINALALKNVLVHESPSGSSGTPYRIQLNGTDSWVDRGGITLPDVRESFALIPETTDGGTTINVVASDPRGFSYGITELADRVAHSSEVRSAFTLSAPIVEQPANELRGVMRLFTSEVEDKPWFYDRDFWTRYLDEIATQRFNRFHLAFGIGYDFLRDVSDVYFVFAYPYLFSVPGYDVRVSNLSSEEQAKNLETLRFISDETARRGLEFQMGLWTQQYEWTDSPNPHQTIEGLDAETHPYYCRDALRMLLQECPSITGVTLRVHGESGIPEGNNHLWKIILDGVAQCGREVEIDLHPKGVNHDMIQVALDTGMPTAVSPKYIAEHMGLPAHQAAIRPSEQETRSDDIDGFVANLMNLSHGELRFTRYSYANFLAEDRPYDVFYRIWPGTQRLLLWGSPEFAAGYGRYGTFGRSRGIEIFEPLSFKGRRGSGLPGGRLAYNDDSLVPKAGDFAKYEYTYRLFGRHLFNPDCDPDVWRRYLHTQFGPASGHVERALAEASEILPLVTTAHHPSAANNRFWPEIYTNMPIVDEVKRRHHYVDTIQPRRFSTVSPADSELFLSIEHFVDEILSGQRSGRYSPLTVATWLEQRATDAASALERARQATVDAGEPAFRRLAVDVSIQVALGRFFAEKLRAGVAYTLFERCGSIDKLRAGVSHYQAARDAWKDAIKHGKVYRDDITVGEHPFLRGHWSDRLEAIELDLSDMEEKLQHAESSSANEAGNSAIDASSLQDIDARLNGVSCQHEPPSSFVPGQTVPIALRVDDRSGSGAPLEIELRYRHVNHGESRYQGAMMARNGNEYNAEIPGDYTDSSFPLMYYFTLRGGDGNACLHPGFDDSLANQPYYYVPQHR